MSCSPNKWWQACHYKLDTPSDMEEYIRHWSQSAVAPQLQFKNPGSSPISNLPEDVFRVVFMHAKNKYDVSLSVLCQVCMGWYAIAVSTKELWTDVIAGPMFSLSQAHRTLERSYPLPIDFILDLRYPNRPGIDEYWRRHCMADLGIHAACRHIWQWVFVNLFTAEQFARCKSITIRSVGCYTSLSIAETLSDAQNVVAPNLQRIECDILCDPEECNRRVPWAMDILPIEGIVPKRGQCGYTKVSRMSTTNVFSIRAPKLNTVLLSGQSLGTIIMDFSNVTKLVLSSRGTLMGCDKFIALLQGFPRLQNLHIDSNIYNDWLPTASSGTINPPILLKHLTTLTFGDRYYDDMLPLIHTPKLQQLTFEDFWPGSLDELKEHLWGRKLYRKLTEVTLGITSSHWVYPSLRDIPYITDFTRYSSGLHLHVEEVSEDSDIGFYRDAIWNASVCFPHVKKLVIHELLVSDVVAALTPVSGM
ncbi:hypothetical protein AX16_001246, partial [Volvariella volvacea WC 439]